MTTTQQQTDLDNWLKDVSYPLPNSIKTLIETAIDTYCDDIEGFNLIGFISASKTKSGLYVEIKYSYYKDDDYHDVTTDEFEIIF